MSEPNRIAEIREQLGWSRPELARRADTSPQQIERLEKGQRKLSLEWMHRIAIALNCDPADLIAGKGVLMIGSNLQGRTKRPSAGKAEIEHVPVYDLALSAGPGAYVDGSDPEPAFYQPFDLNWLRSITQSPTDNLLVCQVSGDSMESTLRPGDQVLIDRGSTRLTRDGIYALNFDNDLLIKRLTIDPVRRLVTISSDNVAYRSFEDVKPEDVIVIGRVIWLGRRV